MNIYFSTQTVEPLYELIHAQYFDCSRTFFEDDNPMEFLIYWIIQLLAAGSYLIMFSAFSSCFIGLCIYLGAFMDDIESISFAINREIGSDKVNFHLTRGALAELVQLHNYTLRQMKCIF